LNPSPEPIPLPARAWRSSAETREHVLNVAEKLFYVEGIRATGVDKVASRSGVAPTTLYRLFDSKDDLVAAYVERCSERYKAALSAAMSAAAPSPRERILAVIDVFAEEVGSPTCRGCPFLIVLAEYPDPSSPPHVKAVAHKTWLRDLFHNLVGELALTTKLRDAASLADGLTLLADGMYGSVQALGPFGPAAYGRACAEALSEAAGGNMRSRTRAGTPLRSKRSK